MGIQEQRDAVHSFHGTRETYAGDFVIDTDRSLDEDLNVLTMWHYGDDGTFMGWIDGGDCGKYVQVPKRLASTIARYLSTAVRAGWARGLNEDDDDLYAAFVRAVNRCSPTPSDIEIPPEPTDEWVITGPYGIEWQGVAEDELAALDALANSEEMETYSDAIRRNVLEGEDTMVYRLDGVIHAIRSNYEVEVIRHMPARQVRVHLDVAVEPSDKRSADEIGKAVVHYLDANVEITHMVSVEKVR